MCPDAFQKEKKKCCFDFWGGFSFLNLVKIKYPLLKENDEDVLQEYIYIYIHIYRYSHVGIL